MKRLEDLLFVSVLAILLFITTVAVASLIYIDNKIDEVKTELLKK